MENMESPGGAPPPPPPPPAPRCKTKSKKLLIVALIALVLLVGVVEAKRRMVAKQLEELTVSVDQLDTGNPEQNREQAKNIVQRVGKLMVIDTSVEPTVATIVDVEALRKKNTFYNQAENGDFLVVTPQRAILYNAQRNIILDVVPVQIQPAKEAAPEEPAEE